MAEEDIARTKHFLKIACDEAIQGVTSGKGGPFGAVVVKDGEIIAQVHNTVLISNDPTAHAEVNAIRAASAKLGTYNLEGSILYSSCEPCPMCLGACLWASVRKVYFACTKEDAALVGFNDGFFYSVVVDEKKRYEYSSAVPGVENMMRAMQLWNEKLDKLQY